MKVCNLLRRVGIVSHALGLLLFLLGFMTTYWADMSNHRGSAGLWQICQSTNYSGNGNSSENSSVVFVNRHRIHVHTPRGARPRVSIEDQSTDNPPPSSSKASVLSQGSIHENSGDSSIAHAQPEKRARVILGDSPRASAPTQEKVHGTFGDADAMPQLNSTSEESNAIVDDFSFWYTYALPEKLTSDDKIDNNDDVIVHGGVTIHLDSDGCWVYGINVDAYLHTVRVLMAFTAIFYGYGVLNGSTRRVRIQLNTSFTKQHRGEILSYTGACLSSFAVEIYKFGYRTDTYLDYFVHRRSDLQLGWSAYCVRLSSFIVLPSVVLLLAPTLRIKLNNLLSDCCSSIGCADEDGNVTRGPMYWLSQDFCKDPLGNCFRFITCRRPPPDELSPDTEMASVDRRYTSSRSQRLAYETDSRNYNAPPPPYSFLHPVPPDGSRPTHNNGFTRLDSNQMYDRDEQYFVVSGILSVGSIPGRPRDGSELAPLHRDNSPPPSYEEVMRGLDDNTGAFAYRQVQQVQSVNEYRSDAVPDSPLRAAEPSSSSHETDGTLLYSRQESNSSAQSTHQNISPTHNFSPVSPTSSPNPLATSSSTTNQATQSVPDTPSTSQQVTNYEPHIPTSATQQSLPLTPVNQTHTAAAATAVAAAVVSAASNTPRRHVLPTLRPFPHPSNDRDSSRSAQQQPLLSPSLPLNDTLENQNSTGDT